MDKKEVLFVVALVGGMVVPPAVIGQWWLFGTVMTFFVCFGLFEWMSVKQSGKSISQKFWEYGKEHPVGKIYLLSGWAVAWVALLIHLSGG